MTDFHIWYNPSGDFLFYQRTLTLIAHKVKRQKVLKSGYLSEESIHSTVIDWVRKHPFFRINNRFRLILHFPNEGKRTLRYGKLMKDLGMRKGVSDLFIAMPCNGFGGAWIELKSETGRLGVEQKEFLEDMKSQNYFTAVCWSIEEAMNTISSYCGIGS